MKAKTQGSAPNKSVKRQGRPHKQAKLESRSVLSLRVTAKTKAALMKLAVSDGRTLSAVGEQLIAQSLRDRWLLNQISKINKSRVSEE